MMLLGITSLWASGYLGIHFKDYVLTISRFIMVPDQIWDYFSFDVFLFIDLSGSLYHYYHLEMFGNENFGVFP